MSVAVDIRIGDALELLQAMSDEAVQCCVTSPPYFGLRKYGDDPRELGQEKTPELYIERLAVLFEEVRRVLKKDGTLFLNMGDSYFGSGKGGNPESSPHKKQRTNAGSLDVGYAPKYGIADKEVLNSLGRVPSCESPYGVRKDAFVLGIERIESRLVLQRFAELLIQTQGSMDASIFHFPTLDFSHLKQIRQSSASILDQARLTTRAVEPLPAFVKSMRPESLLPQSDHFRLSGNLLAFRDELRTLEVCASQFVDRLDAWSEKPDCTDGIDELCGQLLHRTQCISISCECVFLALGYIKPRHATVQDLKPKDLIGIPWMLAFALRARGWYLRCDIVWAKANCMPESVTDRPTRSHEFIFLLSKSAKYYYNHEAIKEPCIYDVDGTGTAAQKARAKEGMKSHPEGERAGIRPGGYKNSVNFEGKNAGNEKQRGHSRRHAGFNDRLDAMKKDEQCTGMRNMRDVWRVAPSNYPGAHFATFPADLIRPCVLAGTRSGDVVLDPFGGSGTVGEVALEYGRSAILIELYAKHGELAKQRCNITEGLAL
jgi:DNA modification methylase